MKRVNLTKEQCCGCGACYNRCPKQAVTMQADAEGFLYPVIDDALCVDCGLCVKACPAYHEREVSVFEQQYAAAQHTNEETRMCSSSGGVFSALMEAVLSQNGVVYGAAFDEQFRLRHTRADTSKAAMAFRGSKYMQSDIGDTMKTVAADLKDGRTVLFSGTPCQVDGLKRYLQTVAVSTDNLLTCDFVCHGVASPMVWKDYVAFLMQRHGALKGYDFRCKTDGWHDSFPKILTVEGDVSRQYKEKESFFRLYSTCNITRPTCYTCRYTSYERVSDITLGDFWNIGKSAPEMDDDKGTSQIIVNTQTGAYWMQRVQMFLCQQELKKEDVWQLHLEFPINAPTSRTAFWKMYDEKSFEQIIQQYGKLSFIGKCRKLAMRIANVLGLYVLAGKLYQLVFVRKK